MAKRPPKLNKSKEEIVKGFFKKLFGTRQCKVEEIGLIGTEELQVKAYNDEHTVYVLLYGYHIMVNSDWEIEDNTIEEEPRIGKRRSNAHS